MKIYRDNPYQKDAEELLKKILDSNGDDVNEIAYNFIKEKGFNIEQMKRVVQTANILLFHENLKKGIQEFDVIDPVVIENMMQKNVEEGEEKKSSEFSFSDDYYIIEEKSAFEIDRVIKPTEYKIQIEYSESYKSKIEKVKEIFK